MIEEFTEEGGNWSIAGDMKIEDDMRQLVLGLIDHCNMFMFYC